MMIEKKICLKLLLCSLTVFFSLVVSVLFFGTSCKAAYDESNITDWYVEKGFNLSNYPTFDDDINSFYTYYANNQNYKCLQFWINPSYLVLVCGDSLTYSQGSSSLTLYVNATSGQYWQINPSGTSPQHFVVPFTGEISFNPVGYGTSNKVLYNSYSEIGLQTIDWENPYYSANIKAPSVNITYRELTTVPTVDVPLNVSIEEYNDFYFESFAIFCVPTTLAVTVNQGQYVYDGFNISNLRYNLVEPQDLKKPDDYSVDSFHLLMNDGWYNRQLPDSAFDFLFPTGASSSFQDSARNKYMNLRKNMCMGGNQIYLYFRYFTVIDNQVVVGPWRIWTSYDPSTFTEEIPDYIQPYLPAVGTIGTTTEVNPAAGSTPEPTQIYNPSSTGQNINIEVKQNVPNYPDYPTIASYNKDNLLVDTINSLNSFTQFFGDFGLFLTAAFGFIPEWIWGIIGVGFSLSIIVMFLKIL